MVSVVVADVIYGTAAAVTASAGVTVHFGADEYATANVIRQDVIPPLPIVTDPTASFPSIVGEVPQLLTAAVGPVITECPSLVTRSVSTSEPASRNCST